MIPWFILGLGVLPALVAAMPSVGYSWYAAAFDQGYPLLATVGAPSLPTYPTSCNGLPGGTRCTTAMGRDGTCKGTGLFGWGGLECQANQTQQSGYGQLQQGDCSGQPSGTRCKTVMGRDGACKAGGFLGLGGLECQANSVPTDNNKPPATNKSACAADGQECVTGTNNYKGICRHGGFFGFTGLTGLECQSTGELAPVTPEITPPSTNCLALFDLNHDGVIDQTEYDAMVKRRGQHSLNNDQNKLIDDGSCKVSIGATAAINPATGLPPTTNAVDPVSHLSVPTKADCAPLIKPYDRNANGILDQDELQTLTGIWSKPSSPLSDEEYFKILACRDGGAGATGGTPPPPPSDTATQPLPGGQGPPKHIDVPGLKISPDVFNDVNGDDKFTEADCDLLVTSYNNPATGQYLRANPHFDFNHDGSVGSADVIACRAYFKTPPPVASSSIPVTISCTPPTAVGLKAGDTITCTANSQPAAGHSVASYLWKATFPSDGTGTDQTFTFSVPSTQSAGLLTVTVTGDDNATGTSLPVAFTFPAPTTPPAGKGTAPVPNISLSIQPSTIALTVGNQQCYYGQLLDNGEITWDWTGQWHSAFTTPYRDETDHTYCLTPATDDVGKAQSITLDVVYQGKSYHAVLPDITVNPAAGQIKTPTHQIDFSWSGVANVPVLDNFFSYGAVMTVDGAVADQWINPSYSASPPFTSAQQSGAGANAVYNITPSSKASSDWGHHALTLTVTLNLDGKDQTFTSPPYGVDVAAPTNQTP